MIALTTREAAFVVGLSDRMVNRIIDRDLPRGTRIRSGRRQKRYLGPAEVVYLAMYRESGKLLSKAGRKTLYRQLRQSVGDLSLEETYNFNLKLGPFTAPVSEVVGDLSQRLAELRRINELVISDLEICGGEPVIRGTRVPVYLLADLKAQNVSDEEILEDYPSIDLDALRAAVVYAQIRPRRGRPRASAPWRE